jgi:hypothetical protein
MATINSIGSNIPIEITKGGTGAASLTAHGVLVGEGTGAIAALSVGTTGQLLVGATGADPTFASSATGDFTFTSSTAGATRTFTVSNTDNTNASSTALIVASTGGASAGDAVYRASTTATNWSWGVDNSASDAFVVAQGTALGTNNVMSVATAGQINYPLQPGFFAYNSATVSNVTGDGTDYTIIFDTELYDVGSNYNNATGTFTAPVTGKYLFTMVLSLTSIAGTHTSAVCFIATTTNQYRMFAVNPTAVAITGGNLSFSGSVIVPLTAGQQANCHITVGTTGKTVGVFGNANGNTSFSAQLLA